MQLHSSFWIDQKPLPHRDTPGALYEALIAHPAIIASSEQITSPSTVQLVPRHPMPEPIYVFQKEYNLIPRTANMWIGSDRATTCHILIAISNTQVFCAHLDGHPEQMEHLAHLFQTHFFAKGETELLLHLAGGFEDSSRTSRRLGEELLWTLQGIPAVFHLEHVCIGPLNTMQKRVSIPGKRSRRMDTTAPIIRALAWDNPTQKVLPNIWFADLGPQSQWRAAHAFCGQTPLLKGPDPITKQFDPANSAGLHPPDKLSMISLVNMPNDWEFAQYVSTSPLVEHASFCEEIRETLRFLMHTLDGNQGK